MNELLEKVSKVDISKLTLKVDFESLNAKRKSMKDLDNPYIWI